METCLAAGISGAAGAAAIANNPLVMTISVAYTADAVFRHCECKAK
jgi:hypothetical protein